MKNMPDFRKVFIQVRSRDGKAKKHLAGVIHLNYMFPVPTSAIQRISAANIDLFRSFVDIKQKSKYIDLLNKELKTIDQLNLRKRALYLYRHQKDFPNDQLSSRCLNFDNLIHLAKNWQAN